MFFYIFLFFVTQSCCAASLTDPAAKLLDLGKRALALRTPDLYKSMTELDARNRRQLIKEPGKDLIDTLEALHHTPLPYEEQIKLICEMVLIWHGCDKKGCSKFFNETNIKEYAYLDKKYLEREIKKTLRKSIAARKGTRSNDQDIDAITEFLTTYTGKSDLFDPVDFFQRNNRVLTFAWWRPSPEAS